ncbi:GPP34 family phosphoprotein [Saccharopolyspora sp. HNM0983]|uniref:GPP34 family phosphoprotein n=1 Tax=Saccharopolyspora montiporae TaxID=2781240 RepID=A0A929FYT5_9PSEU|nr:GPP34 family phosphoprotein [Saccharopolyspora sp. HNM0983]MBE9373042.1 GPP34 family phosphoprotein [Saccharopolyspora sp. HNM0983]
MLITEELFLLLRRDDGKPESALAQNGYGLAGAVVSDLVLAEQVAVSDDEDPRLSAVPDAHAEHPVLAAALDRLRERDGTKLSSLVADRKLNPEQDVVRSLTEAGMIRVEEKRALGFVPEKYPTVDAEPERALRERLRAVLAGGTPQPADGVLLSILQGIDLVARVLDEEKGELGKKDLKRRIAEVSEESVAGHAVAKAVRSVNTAIMSAVIIPGVVTGGS